MRVMRNTGIFLILAVVIALTACANDPYLRTKSGAGLGAVIGGILGHQIGDNTAGTVIGAASGAILGGAVGSYMDKQQLEFERALAREQQQHGLEIERMRDDTLRLSVNNEAIGWPGGVHLSSIDPIAAARQHELIVFYR